MKSTIKVSLVLTTLLLGACASIPNGPSNMALPGTGKSFDQFRYDDGSCRQFAHDQIGGTTANQAADNSFVGSAIVGTVLGAAIGAAAGGDEGAGVGAATGLFVGSLMGVDEAHASAYGAQHRYDNAYVQCMYAKGHRVPVSGHIEQQPAYRQPPRPARYPPPPPGYVPPDIRR
ncbi:MAG: YMGG-like glycine zipper-containing protein [Pseudomonadota bacterium]